MREKADMDSNTIEVTDLVNAARDLIGEMPDNPEYDRGVIELLATVLGIDGSIVRAFLGRN